MEEELEFMNEGELWEEVMRSWFPNSGIYSSEIQEICSNFIDLYSESKNFGHKESMKLTFLYDYNKQTLFDHRGVLYSRESEELAKLDESK